MSDTLVCLATEFLCFGMYVCLGLQDELHEEKKHVSQLKGDFDYNLSLLASRDEELADYEKSFSHMKSVVNTMVAESSELKVRRLVNDTPLLLHV